MYRHSIGQRQEVGVNPAFEKCSQALVEPGRASPTLAGGDAWRD